MSTTTPKVVGAKKGKKEKKHVVHGIAHVHASFNNTIVTITDLEHLRLYVRDAGGAEPPRALSPEADGPQAPLEGVRPADPAGVFGIAVEASVGSPLPGRSHRCTLGALARALDV